MANLPSFMRDNPWLEILSRRGRDVPSMPADTPRDVPTHKASEGAGPRAGTMSCLVGYVGKRPAEQPDPARVLGMVERLLSLADAAGARSNVVVVPIIIPIYMAHPGFCGADKPEMSFPPREGGVLTRLDDRPHGGYPPCPLKSCADGSPPRVGGGPGRVPKLDYLRVRGEFLAWYLGEASEEYVMDKVRYLDRYAAGGVLRRPEDVREVFAACERGRDSLAKGLKALFRFARTILRMPEDWCTRMAEAVKIPSSGVRVRLPDDEAVFLALRRTGIKAEYRTLFRLIVFSGGIRTRHAIELIEGFNEGRLKTKGDFAVYELGLARGRKRQLHVFMPRFMVDEIRSLKAKIRAKNADKYMAKYLVPAAFVRNWAYTWMRRLKIAADVADYIQGRAPEGVGPRHYFDKLVAAEEEYPKYLRWLLGRIGSGRS